MLSCILGLLYRSASIYHPQRRAILHLKNQRRRMKKKGPGAGSAGAGGSSSSEKKSPRILDLAPLKARPVRVLLLAAAIAALGLYTPVFLLALQGLSEGLEDSALVLLQTFLGLAAALGCVGFGLVVAQPSLQCLVSRQYLCQASLLGIAAALLALSAVRGYHGYALLAWLYGGCLGGFLYSLKMLALERVRPRYFSRAWALVQAGQALPVLLGAPLAGYINDSHPRAGYYLSCLATLIGAALLFLVGGGPSPRHRGGSASGGGAGGGGGGAGGGGAAGAGLCRCGALLPPPPALRASHAALAAAAARASPAVRARLPKSVSMATTLDMPPPTCLSQEALFWDAPVHVQDYHHLHHHHHHHAPHHHRPLRPCKSVPEGLARFAWMPPYPAARPPRNVTVVEQMTTSV